MLSLQITNGTNKSSQSLTLSLALCLNSSLTEWAVFWLPAPPTLRHQPLAVLPSRGWRCRRALGCLRFPQLSPLVRQPRDSSRRQKTLCLTRVHLMSVIASAKVNRDKWGQNEVPVLPGVAFLCILAAANCVCMCFSSEVFPMQMEGVRLVVNKGLSNHFQVSQVPFHIIY